MRSHAFHYELPAISTNSYCVLARSSRNKHFFLWISICALSLSYNAHTHVPCSVSENNLSPAYEFIHRESRDGANEERELIRNMLWLVHSTPKNKMATKNNLAALRINPFVDGFSSSSSPCRYFLSSLVQTSIRLMMRLLILIVAYMSNIPNSSIN